MTVKNGLPPIHPGEFLKEALEELGTSQAEFARAIGVSPMRVSHIVKGARPVTAELALLFGRAFGASAGACLIRREIRIREFSKMVGIKVFTVAGLLLAVAAVCMQPAFAQSGDPAADYPAKHIHILVGFTPGGGPDITARYVAQKLGETWKQQVIV